MPSTPFPPVTTAVFDLGGVVVQWRPRAAFAGLLTEPELDEYLSAIDFPAWNRLQDGGRSWAEAEEQIVRAHPHYAHLAGVYRANFHRVIDREVEGVGAILTELRDAGVRLLAITNFAADLFAQTFQRFAVLSLFEGIVVSGVERLLKPDPAIYQLLFARYGVLPGEAVFIDDTVCNVVAAREIGMRAVHFVDAAALRAQLTTLGLPLAAGPAAP